MDRPRLTRRRFAQAGAAAAAIAGIGRRARAAPPGPIEKPRLTLGIPLDAASFTPVYVNEGLTLDFADRERFEGHHFCFRVSDEQFDAIFVRLQARQIAYRSHPRGENDKRRATHHTTAPLASEMTAARHEMTAAVG